MNKYLIRFNKSRGQPNRGSRDHVWRVFEGEKEYIFKNFKINVPSYSEASGNSPDDYNICCHGYMTVDKETSTAIINETATQ
jgi:hypothetical protein